MTQIRLMGLKKFLLESSRKKASLSSGAPQKVSLLYPGNGRETCELDCRQLSCSYEENLLSEEACVRQSPAMRHRRLLQLKHSETLMSGCMSQ